MLKKLPLAWGVVCLGVLPLCGAAGPTNPDISVIGDSRIAYNDVTEEVELSLHEVEFAFVGPVNPYASAEVYIGVHDGNTFEIEEAKLVLDRYLPGGLGLTIGRMLLDFGQLNQVHTHAFPFVERPLMHREFFGDDGAADVSARLDWIAPIDAFTLRGTAGIIGGSVVTGGHGHEEDHEEHLVLENEEGHEEEEASSQVGLTGRLEAFFEPSHDTALLIGVSAIHGEHDPAEEAKGTWLGLDAKGTVDFGPYRQLIVNGEFVTGTLDETGEQAQAEPTGWFLSADVRANKRWNLGGFAESSSERLDEDHTTTRYGAFVGMSLMEESTMFRLVGHVTDPEDGESETGVFLQVLFGLGPHRPHRY